jgi:hypothetical protein
MADVRHTTYAASLSLVLSPIQPVTRTERCSGEGLVHRKRCDCVCSQPLPWVAVGPEGTVSRGLPALQQSSFPHNAAVRSVHALYCTKYHLPSPEELFLSSHPELAPSCASCALSACVSFRPSILWMRCTIHQTWQQCCRQHRPPACTYWQASTQTGMTAMDGTRFCSHIIRSSYHSCSGQCYKHMREAVMAMPAWAAFINS